ncbi:ABC transporter substrate-binding protein [Acuticoccus mangrovi]|uniref:ABC transporter substrate-binding protein n=1 Tax=Acuticoccus mangrovi TaxID=2796142 RepID=A0A934MN85_9HYPH|nr:ABC transporter substrate-binding protein [Acuticoccus mangrovi]MBJ3777959.1 ABC transporter substrate-binding protein [Acuticoccus mangrovi]
MDHHFIRHALAATAIVGTAIVGTATTAQATDYPLTLTNCGVELTFDAPPERVVTIGQSATESLYTLGVGETVVGTSVWFNPVLPRFAALDAGIERLADNDPSFESVVDKRPDLVAIQYEWHVGPEGIVATREQFHELGINTYVMPADCDTKDNTTGGDGTRTAAFSTTSIYKGLTELSEIFDVEDAGEALVADLEGREAAAIAKAKALDLPDDTSAVFWFSSAEIEVDPYVAGQKGAPGYIMDKLGIINVIQSDEEWPTVGWETIARADPTIVVVAQMDRRRFPADDIEVKKAFLATDPVVKEMTAVREGRIVVMDAHAMSATMRTIFGLETVADALAALDLAQ